MIKPNTEPRYQARFYFGPNSIPTISGDAHFIFKGLGGASTDVQLVEIVSLPMLTNLVARERSSIHKPAKTHARR